MFMNRPICEIDFDRETDRQDVQFISSINQRIDDCIKSKNQIELKRIGRELFYFLEMVKFGKIITSQYVQKQSVLLLKKISRGLSMTENITKQELIQLIQETIKEVYDDIPDPLKGGSSSSSEKMNTNESISPKNEMLIKKWCQELGNRKAAIRMIDSVLKQRIGLGTDDLSDTTIFADGIDDVEGLLNSADYAGALFSAKETAQAMLEDEDGLS